MTLALRSITGAASTDPACWLMLTRDRRGSFFGWMEKLRRLWERRFDRLGDYLRKLQQKERQDGRKK